MSEHKDLDQSYEEESSYDILTLLDEEGEEHQFELIDTIELDGQEYHALIPIFEDPDDFLQDSGDLVIMRSTDVDGELFLDTIEDDDEYEQVSEIFIERLSDDFDIMEEFDETFDEELD